MKALIDGFYSLILSILNSNNQIKDWNKWSHSFDHILSLPQVESIFEGDTNEFSLNEIIDTLFKIENEMTRFIMEGKATTNAKWHKFVGELVMIKACE